MINLYIPNIFLSTLKILKKAPLVYNKGSKDHGTNCMPMSLLPIFSKNFEKKSVIKRSCEKYFCY